MKNPFQLEGSATAVAAAATRISRFARLCSPRVRPSLVLLASLFLAGCAVGPNFKKPSPPEVKGYTATPLSTTSGTTNIAGGEPQSFAAGHDIPGQWWALFHSKPLNDLIERSLTNNPDLKSAQAALVVARENLLAQRGSYFPSIGGSFDASRHQTPNLINPFVTQSSPEGSVY